MAENCKLIQTQRRKRGLKKSNITRIVNKCFIIIIVHRTKRLRNPWDYLAA